MLFFSGHESGDLERPDVRSARQGRLLARPKQQQQQQAQQQQQPQQVPGLQQHQSAASSGPLTPSAFNPMTATAACFNCPSLRLPTCHTASFAQPGIYKRWWIGSDYVLAVITPMSGRRRVEGRRRGGRVGSSMSGQWRQSVSPHWRRAGRQRSSVRANRPLIVALSLSSRCRSFYRIPPPTPSPLRARKAKPTDGSQELPPSATASPTSCKIHYRRAARLSSQLSATVWGQFRFLTAPHSLNHRSLIPAEGPVHTCACACDRAPRP
uniref:Uncharacterized protein n=1 Tax=Plectus sambesii TaxID=2011161 RepID=A0A914UPF1_9BILA